MQRNFWRMTMAAVLATVTAASAGAQAQGSGIPVRKDVDRAAMTGASTAGGRTMMTSGGDVELARSMTDANITDHLYGGDSLEVAIAQLAQVRAQDQRVRDFAAMLVRDHTNDMALVRELITDEDIGRMRNPADTSAMHMRHMYQELQGLSGAAFDRAFMMHQVHHHSMELAMAPAMRAAARDDDLEQHLDKLMPILRTHRDTGMQVAMAMGISMPMNHDMPGMNHAMPSASGGSARP